MKKLAKVQKRILFFNLIPLLTWAQMALAEDTNHSKSDQQVTQNTEQNKEKDDWTANVELGYVATSGNTKTTTVNAGIGVSHERNNWRHSLDMKAIFGSAENTTTSQVETNAERYFIQGKTDYKYSESSYAFVLANYDENRFSDNDFQFSTSVGRGFSLAMGEKTQLDLELGIGYRQTQKKTTSLLPEETLDETIFRFAGHFRWDISNNAKFEQKLSAEIGSDNTVTKSYTGLSANIIDNLALKLSITATNQSSVRGDTKKLDTISAFTLVYNF